MKAICAGNIPSPPIPVMQGTSLPLGGTALPPHVSEVWSWSLCPPQGSRPSSPVARSQLPSLPEPTYREKGKPRAGAGLLSSASRLGEGCQFSKRPVGATRVPSTRVERSVPAPSLCSGRADLLICSSSLHFSDMPLGEMSARQLWDQMSPC